MPFGHPFLCIAGLFLGQAVIVIHKFATLRGGCCNYYCTDEKRNDWLFPGHCTLDNILHDALYQMENLFVEDCRQHNHAAPDGNIPENQLRTLLSASGQTLQCPLYKLPLVGHCVKLLQCSFNLFILFSHVTHLFCLKTPAGALGRATDATLLFPACIR